jgi:hypothetical protein
MNDALLPLWIEHLEFQIRGGRRQKCCADIGNIGPGGPGGCWPFLWIGYGGLGSLPLRFGIVIAMFITPREYGC